MPILLPRRLLHGAQPFATSFFGTGGVGTLSAAAISSSVMRSSASPDGETHPVIDAMGAEVVQDFPDECVPLRCGVRTDSFTRLGLVP